MTQEQADLDTRLCQEQAGYSGGGFFLIGPAVFVVPAFAVLSVAQEVAQANYIDCMKGKGYTPSDTRMPARPAPTDVEAGRQDSKPVPQCERAIQADPETADLYFYYANAIYNDSRVDQAVVA